MKLEIKKIELENYGMFQQHTVFEFHKGIWRVFGMDGNNASKSNGIGKSTIFLSIPYTLWGTLGKRKKIDGVINKETKKNCMTCVEFSIDSKTYRVERYRKHHKHKNSLILKIKEGKIWNDVSLAETALTQEAIDNILNINSDIFMKSILLSAETTPSFFELSTNDRHDLIESLVKLDFSEFEKKIKKRMPLFNKEVSSVNSAFSGAKSNVQMLTRFTKDLVKEKFAFVRQKNSEIAKLSSELDHQINFSVNHFETYMEITNTLTAKKYDLQTAKGEIKSLEFKKQTLERELQTLVVPTDTPTCSECGREFEPDSKQHLAHVQKLKQKTERIEKTTAQLSTQLAEIETALIENQKTIETIMSEIKEGLAKRNLLSVPEEVIENQNVWRARVQNKERSLEKIQQLTTERWNAKKLQTTLTELREAKSELQELETKLAALQEEEVLLEYWKTVFNMKEDGNIKSYLIKKIIPTFNKICNDFLDIAFDGKMTVAFDESFDPALVFRGSEYEYIDLSRGEKCKLNLCTNLAIFTLVRMNLVSTNLLLLDEIFSGMEIESIEKFLNIFRKTYKDLGLYVISHERGMDELLDDAKSITVKKIGEFESVIV